MQSKLTFSRKPVAHLDRRRELAQQIVDRHPEEEQETAWAKYTAKLGLRGAKGYAKMRKSRPETMAELLEPGVLDRMVVADRESAG